MPRLRNATAALPTDAGSMPAGTSGLAALTEAKLWRNPCWFSARFNHIALRYNTPLYGWVERRYGLSRPEFVVIYSLGLMDGALARDISISSGFAKNTLSRAIQKLCRMQLIERRVDDADRRNQTLHLLPAGQRMFDEALPQFLDYEQNMLSTLTQSERDTLSRLLAKIVLDSVNWEHDVADPSAAPQPGSPAA